MHDLQAFKAVQLEHGLTHLVHELLAKKYPSKQVMQ